MFEQANRDVGGEFCELKAYIFSKLILIFALVVSASVLEQNFVFAGGEAHVHHTRCGDGQIVDPRGQAQRAGIGQAVLGVKDDWQIEDRGLGGAEATERFANCKD